MKGRGSERRRREGCQDKEHRHQKLENSQYEREKERGIIQNMVFRWKMLWRAAAYCLCLCAMQCSKKRMGGVKEKDNSHDHTPAVLILSRHTSTVEVIQAVVLSFQSVTKTVKDTPSPTHLISHICPLFFFSPRFINIFICFMINVNVKVWHATGWFNQFPKGVELEENCPMISC